MPSAVLSKKGVGRKDVEGALTEAKYAEFKNQVERMKEDYQGTVDKDGFAVKPERDPELAQQIAYMENFLALHAPKQFRAIEKDKLAARKKELETIITDNMPTRNEMWKVPGKDGYRADMALDKHIKWEAKNRFAIQEWQDIARALEPENPNAANIETIRRAA